MGLEGTVTLRQLLLSPQADSLAEAALILAQEVEPALDVHHYLQRLHFYAEAVSERLPPEARLGDALFQLNDYLFNDRGFHVEGEYDSLPENNFLNHLIDQRSGAPLGLAMLYLTVGRSLGLPMVALTFPGRVLVRYSDEEGEVVLDPAQGGMPLQENDLAMLFQRAFALPLRAQYHPTHFLAPTDDRTMLVRMLRQMKHSYLQHANPRGALWALEKILELVPDMADGFRERGQLYELLDCSLAAAEDYSRYLELMPDARDAGMLRKRLPRLLSQSITLH